MSTLNSALRAILQNAVVTARTQSEAAAKAALQVLCVDRRRASPSMTLKQRAQRNSLRAKARQLGAGNENQGFEMLVEDVAYARWHRMLFARFLAENSLLMHPLGVSVTLRDCEELAVEEGDLDLWTTAERYAAEMLPGIFSVDDPSVQVQFAPEGRASLIDTLTSLPTEIFCSEDGLGWVYQFWQTNRKRQIASDGRKIEGLDLAAYSQLFTEGYMVRFLLENTLGAWWGARNPSSELVTEFKYLRFEEDGVPSAGTFPDWPVKAADITVMDPCCGSGHFLVAAFDMLCRMRMEEEGLSEMAAADAVLRDNIFGLEIDPRCVQIAAFALALTAWRAGGYRAIPLPNIACSGIPIRGQLEEWVKLSDGDEDMKESLENLHALFLNSEDVGSLIDPLESSVQSSLFSPEFDRVSPLLNRALRRENINDPVSAVFGSAALGVIRAASLLSRRYTLVATNVPYLQRGKQGDTLRSFLERHHSKAKSDLATAFLERCRSFCAPGGAYALVTPQNWLFLGSYQRLREVLLREQSWKLMAKLGERAFESSAAAGAFVTLLIIQNIPPTGEDRFSERLGRV